MSHDERMLSGNWQPEDEGNLLSLRPSRLSEYIGQSIGRAWWRVRGFATV